ncbi:MAG: HEAT repeat domain-containing protein [bacterium]
MNELTNLERWSRETKLFAIQGLRQLPPEERAPLLLRLITADDPVIRGKTALALDGCSDDTLLDAVDRLLDVDDPTYDILACELLTLTENTDFSERLEPLLNHEEPRVVKSAIEALGNCSLDCFLDLSDEFLDSYDPEYSMAIERVVVSINDPRLLTFLQNWYEVETPGQKIRPLRLIAGLPSAEARKWVSEHLDSTQGSSHKKSFVRWLLDNT